MEDIISKLWISIGLLAVIFISACNSQQIPAVPETISSPYDRANEDTNAHDDAPVSPAATTLATKGELSVQDTIMTQAAVEEEYAKSPAYIKEQVSKEQYTDLLINKELLKAEAKKQGLVADKSAIEASLAEQLTAAGISEAEFAKQLTAQQTTKEKFLEEYAVQQAIFALVTQHTPDVQVSDQEAHDYLLANEPILGQELSAEELSALENQVKRKLVQERKKDALITYVNKLREDAGIEVLP